MKTSRVLSMTQQLLAALAAVGLAANWAVANPAGQALENAPPLAQGGDQQIVAVASGVIELIRGEEASLQTGCAPVGPFVGALVVQRRITYAALAGACGLPGLPACDGRITEITESCLGPDSPTVDVNIGGGQVSGVFRVTGGKMRRCFDPTGGSDCTGPTPLGQVISEGSEPLYGVLRPDPAAPERVIITNTVNTLGYDIADIDGRSVSEEGAVRLRSIYGEGVDRDICGWRGLIESGVPGTGLRACEFIAHDTGSASN